MKNETKDEPEGLRDAVFTVIEGFTLPNDVRKILETAYYNTTPPQRKPLMDEEILTYRYMIDWTADWSYIKFARAIEQAHGIKGEA